MNKAATECPTPKALRDWLDGRQELSDQEIHHCESCSSCSQLLEELSCPPELGKLQIQQNTQPRFDDETELEQVRRRVAELKDETLEIGLEQNTEGVNREGNDSETAELQHQLPSADLYSTARATADPFDTDIPPDEEEGLTSSELEGLLPGSRFRIHRKLGSGGMGQVFLAFDQSLSREVAIKVLSRNKAQDRERFLREARVLGEIEHANVVRIHDVGSLPVGKTQLFMVMEYVEGATAEAFVEEPTKNYLKIARLFAGAARGLAETHKMGIIHRDIKPANLLYDRQANRLKVADFGLARFTHSDATMLTETGDILGTPMYMSPEQVATEPSRKEKQTGKTSINASSDCYSLGVSLFHVITGEPPFLGDLPAIMRQISDTDPVAPRIHNPGIPIDLQTVCLKAMEKARADRYTSLTALAEDLEAFAEGAPIQARPVSSLKKGIRFLQKNRSLAAALLAIALLSIFLIAGSMAAAFLFQKKNSELSDALEGERNAKDRAQLAFRNMVGAADALLVSVTEDADLLPKSPGSQIVSKKLLQRAKQYYVSFLTDFQQDPTLQYELARAHTGLAKVLNRTGEVEKSIEEAEAALNLIGGIEALRVPIEDIAELETDATMALAQAYFSSGRERDSLDAYLDAAEIPILLEDAGNEFELKRVKSLVGASIAANSIGELETAVNTVEQALDISKQLVREEPQNTEYLVQLARTESSMGIQTSASLGWKAAKEHFAAGLDALEQLKEEGTPQLRIIEQRANIRTNLGKAETELGNLQLARKQIGLAIADYRIMRDLEPAVPSHTWLWVLGNLNLTAINFAMEEYQSALETYDTILPPLKELIQLQPDNLEYKEVLGMILGNSATISRELGDFPKALESQLQVIALFEAQAEERENAPETLLALAFSQYEMGTTYEVMEVYEKSYEWLDASNRTSLKILQGHPGFLPAREHLIDTAMVKSKIMFNDPDTSADQSLEFIASRRGAALALYDEFPENGQYIYNLTVLQFRKALLLIRNEDINAALTALDEGIEVLKASVKRLGLIDLDSRFELEGVLLEYLYSKEQLMRDQLKMEPDGKELKQLQAQIVQLEAQRSAPKD